MLMHNLFEVANLCLYWVYLQASRTKKESRSQTRGSIARQQTQTRSAETVATSWKLPRKSVVSSPVVSGTPSKDTKSASKSRVTALSGSVTYSGRSRDIKQASASDTAPSDTAVTPAAAEHQPGATTSHAVTSVRKEKTAGCKTPVKSVLKSRRWVKGGPIEYSTPPSDHSSDKTTTGTVASKQKSTSDSYDSTKGKSSSKKNIALAFDTSDKETDAKQTSKDLDSAPSTSVGRKRKTILAHQGLTAESKDSSLSRGTSGKQSKNSAAVKVEPEQKTKRMARLNAEAIVSLIFKRDEPASQSSKFRDSSDSDIDSDSSEFSSGDEHIRVAKKSRAKRAPVEEDVAGTSKTEEEQREHGGRSPKAKRSPAKRRTSKSEKSSKSQPATKSCKKKSVEVVSSSSWSPPKRMASLNAQVCFHTCQ